jgi:fucose permease
VNLFFGLGGLATPFISANLLAKNSARLCYLMGVVTAITLGIHFATAMPAPAAAQSFALSEIGSVLGKPILFLLAFFLFLYVGCEVGVWNWLARLLISKGIPESRALNILSLGFALGLLIGRVAVSPILINVRPVWVMLASSIGMTLTTHGMFRTSRASAAGVLTFLAGVSMAPVFPTTLAMVGDAFPKMASTALGIVVACGWLGLAVSSRIIGAIAGADPKRLSKALLVIPASSIAMIVVAWAIRAVLP